MMVANVCLRYTPKALASFSPGLVQPWVAFVVL